MSPTHTEFDVPAVVESLDEVQDRFGAWWDGLGIDDVRLRFGLETALAEIAATSSSTPVAPTRKPVDGTP